jgi:hypothetical protein
VEAGEDKFVIMAVMAEVKEQVSRSRLKIVPPWAKAWIIAFMAAVCEAAVVAEAAATASLMACSWAAANAAAEEGLAGEDN